jgi:dTDP-L-rhamnose 4-epimerase
MTTETVVRRFDHVVRTLLRVWFSGGVDTALQPGSRVLVTGGAGFIGSHIVDALIGQGHDVVILDNLDPAAHGERPDYLNAAAQFHEADCRDIEAWRSALIGVDVVCHQAGKVGLGVDFGDVDGYADHNDMGFAYGLRAMHEADFGGRIVLASSMVVYGEGRYRCAVHSVVTPAPRRVGDLDAGRFEPPCPLCGDELVSEEIPESAVLEPRNVYAATKLHQEHLLWAFAREHRVTVAALRYHNVYGGRMPFGTPYAGVASIFRSALEKGVAPKVTEDGQQRRNFVHVRDVAAANLAAMAVADDVLLGCGVSAFNIASTKSRTVGEMAAALATAFGSQLGDDLWPLTTGAYRLGDVRHVYAATGRAAELLGYQSSIDFDAGMREFAVAPLRHPVSRQT